MLTEIYIEALLFDEDLADQVWELWNAGVITDGLAASAWAILVVHQGSQFNQKGEENLHSAYMAKISTSDVRQGAGKLLL